MAGIVNLQDIVDELSMMFDEIQSFVDRETGKVISVSLDERREAEEEDEEHLEEMAEGEAEVDWAPAIVRNPDRYASLPSKDEVNSWEIMREFCETVEPAKRRERLPATEDALREIARDWCEENGIAYVDTKMPRPA